MSANTIVKFETIQERARKSKHKVEIISGARSQNWNSLYAIGPTSIRNFSSHVAKCEEKEDYENCKVFTYETLKEIEAHLNAIEFCVKMVSP